MKKGFCLTIILLLLASVVSCDSVVVGSKKYETRVIELPQETQYDGIAVYDDIEVKVTNGNHAISVYAPDNVQKHISAVIIDGKLVVKYTDGVKVLLDEEPVVFVSYPYLDSKVDNDTISDAIVDDRVMLQTLRVEGDGDIDIDRIYTRHLEAEVIGSGTISLQGAAHDVVLSVKGNGEIDADAMKAISMRATVDGSGDIECTVLNNLEAHVSGRGEIKYQGPVTLQVKSTGRVVREID